MRFCARLTLAALSAIVLVAQRSPAASPVPPRVTITYATARAADGRAVHEGEVVSVVGTANIDSSVLYRDVVKFFIEDKESGISVFIRRAIPPVHAGDVVRVDGRITLYNGSAEIMASEIDLLFRTQPPTPRIVRAADVVGGRYYGRLVRTQGVVIEANSRWRAFEARIHAGRDLLTVRLTEAQRKTFPKIEVGETISVIGIASVYSGGNPPRVSWEILPRYPTDVQVIESRPWITRDAALKAAAAALAIGIVFLLWNLSLRLRVRQAIREA
jgi:hypothetical protein